MRGIIRIKRRPKGGKPGPPDQLAASELAYNEADGTLYYGEGADEKGNAIKVVAIGGAAMLAEIKALRAEIRKLKEELGL